VFTKSGRIVLPPAGTIPGNPHQTIHGSGAEYFLVPLASNVAIDPYEPYESQSL